MSFLAPLFFAGALAIGLPILFHLIRQTSRERQIFSSLMFLSPTPPRLTRRSRIEHLLLLALRCSVIVLLAFAFARPFIKKAPVSASESATAQRAMVLIDTSASMQRAGIWDQAKQAAAASLRGLESGDEVSIYTFDRQLTPVITFDEWNQTAPGERVGLANAKISELKPSSFSTRAGSAVSAAAEILSDSRTNSIARAKHLIVISDMQEGNRWDALQGYEWPRGTTVEVHPLTARRASNASVQLLTESSETDARAPAGVRIRVQNAADSSKDQFRISWASGNNLVGVPHDLQVPPGQSRTISLPVPAQELKADRLQISGDDEKYDNTVFVATPPPAKLSVLYFGPDDGSDPREPLYFIRRAFQDTRSLSVQVVSRKELAALGKDILDSATLIILSGDVVPSDVRAIREQVLAGKTVMAALHDRKMVDPLRQLLDVPALDIQEASAGAFAMMVDLDYKHPVFAPFADPRFADFTRIRFWKHWKLDPGQIPGSRVIAKFDTGTAALVEAPVGKGRLLLWAAGWRPEDSQLALSTKFVPLLYTILEQSGAPPAAPVQYFAGDEAIPPLLDVATNNASSVVPGIYRVAGAEVAARVAVNLDPAESRIQPVTVDELERLGVPMKARIEAPEKRAATQLRLANAELENRQKLWRWIIFGALGVLLIEIWLSGRASRRIVPATAGG